MSITFLRVISAALTISALPLSGAFAADMISAAPQVAHYRKAAAPVCKSGCRDVRVCDDLIVSSAAKTKVVAVCYKAKY